MLCTKYSFLVLLRYYERERILIPTVSRQSRSKSSVCWCWCKKVKVSSSPRERERKRVCVCVCVCVVSLNTVLSVSVCMCLVKCFAFFFFFFFSLSVNEKIKKNKKGKSRGHPPGDIVAQKSYRKMFSMRREKTKKYTRTHTLDDDKTLIKEDHTKNHFTPKRFKRDSY